MEDAEKYARMLEDRISKGLSSSCKLTRKEAQYCSDLLRGLCWEGEAGRGSGDESSDDADVASRLRHHVRMAQNCAETLSRRGYRTIIKREPIGEDLLVAEYVDLTTPLAVRIQYEKLPEL